MSASPPSSPSDPLAASLIGDPPSRTVDKKNSSSKSPASSGPSAFDRLKEFWQAHPVGCGLFVVVFLTSLLYLPFAGSYALSDPWETHYGEVARRMVHTRDYLFLKWQNESFRSKPPLTFWLMAAGMKTFGVGGTWGGGDFAQGTTVEWAIRLPFAMMGILGVSMAYTAIARLVSVRAGLISALLLATTPFYFLVSRQAITDMPACALLLSGLSCYLLAMYDKQAEQPPKVWFKIGPISVTSFWLFFTVFVLFIGWQVVHFWSLMAPQAALRPIYWGTGAIVGTRGYLIGLLVLACATPVLRIAIPKRQLSLPRWGKALVVFAVGFAAGLLPHTGRLLTAPVVGGAMIVGILCALVWLALQAQEFWFGERELPSGFGPQMWRFFEEKSSWRVWPLAALLVTITLLLVFARLTLGPDLPAQLAGRPLIFRFGSSAIATSTFSAMLVATFAFAALLIWTVATCRTQRQIWLYWFYFFNGVGVLAKVYPPLESGLIILIFLILSGDFRILRKSAIIWGVLAVLVVAVFWHIGMFDRDGNGWAQEYFIHHLIKRTSQGVHGDRGSFDYFLQQLGVGLFPWVALIPGALAAAVLQRRIPRAADGSPDGLVDDAGRAARVRLFLAAWAFGTFAFYSLMLTKFHHYILPCVPALILLCGLYVDDILAGRAKNLWLAAAVGLSLLLLVARDFVWNEQRFIHLFVYMYARAWPYDYGLKFSTPFIAFVIAFSVAIATLYLLKPRRIGLFASGAFAVVFTFFMLDHYLTRVSVHWSQKYLIATYYKERKDSSEHLIPWVMNWRGENFYSKSEIWDYSPEPDPDFRTVFMDPDSKKFLEYLKARPGKKFFVICERGQFQSLKGVLRGLRGADGVDLGLKATESFRVEDDSSNKFVLVSFSI